jgi:hypothetical protein
MIRSLTLAAAFLLTITGISIEAQAGSTTQNRNGISTPHRNADKPQTNRERIARQREQSVSPYWHDKTEPKPGRSPRWHCTIQDYNDPRCRDQRGEHNDQR